MQKARMERKSIRIADVNKSLRFVDNIVLFSASPNELQVLVNDLNKLTKIAGLELNSRTLTSCSTPVHFEQVNEPDETSKAVDECIQASHTDKHRRD